MTDLVEALGGATAGTVRLRSGDLERFWDDLLPDAPDAARAAFLEAVQLGATGPAAAGGPPGAGGDGPQQIPRLRPGGWEIDLQGGLVQSVVGGGLIAGLLVALGATQIPAALVTLVVPLLFDVEKVRLTPGQDLILTELVGKREALVEASARDLYARLTDETRAALSYPDFADFMDTCRRAGLADVGEDGTVVVRPPGRARFRITLR